MMVMVMAIVFLCPWSINQFNQHLCSASSRFLFRGIPNPGQAVSKTENKHRLGDAVDLREAHSRLSDQPEKRNGSTLSQSRQIGPPSHCRQRTTVWGGLHKKRECGKADTGSRAPNQMIAATLEMVVLLDIDFDVYEDERVYFV